MRGVLLLAMLAGMASLPAAPQDLGRFPSDRPVFKSRSDLVLLQVTVYDRRSQAVADLPQAAFQVFEEGVPQEITFFHSGAVPVAAGLVIDNSGSMIARHRMVLAGGSAFVESSHSEDELFTIHFNEHVRFGLPPVLRFTSQYSLLRAALVRYAAGGQTALYDAVIAGLDHLESATHQKRVLIVLTDGDDNASRYSEEAMIARARQSDAVIYTVSNDRQFGLRGDPGVLRDLADVTGGVAYFPRTDEAVVRTFSDIAVNIRRGYTIGYVPTETAQDGGFRRVKVVVRAPGRGHVTVRSRHGYTASRQFSSH